MSQQRRLKRRLRHQKIEIEIYTDATLALLAWAMGSPKELMLPGIREKIAFLTSDLVGLKIFAALHGFDVSQATTQEEVRQVILQADDAVWDRLYAHIAAGGYEEAAA